MNILYYLIILIIFIYLIKKKNKEFLVLKNKNLDLERRIDELSDLEKELEDAKEKAEASSRSKSEFLANMSHEIRTPMNSVLGFTELLERTDLEDTQLSYVESIKSSGKNLLNLINDILDLSKIEAGKLSIENKSFNINTLLCEVEQVFTLPMKTKKLDFMIDFSSKVPSLIYSDEIRIRQILLNLVGNAIKFTNKGFVNILVDIVYIDEDYLTLNIYIVDSGIGIIKENQEKIFRDFEQQTNQSSSFGGTGLGLAICKKLANKLGGEISLSSKVNKGSTFSLHLEKIKYSNKNIVLKNSKKKYILKESTVLIVDTHKENRELIKGILEEHSLTIIEAHNFEIALEYLDKVKIDLILIDMKNPFENGAEITNLIRDKSNYKLVPILSITASVHESNPNTIHGFDKIIYKPLIYEEFMDSVTEFLESEIIDELNDSVPTMTDVTLAEEVKYIYYDEFYEMIVNQEKKNNFKELSQLSSQIMKFSTKYKLDDLSIILLNLDKSIKLFDIDIIKKILIKLKNIAQ